MSAKKQAVSHFGCIQVVPRVRVRAVLWSVCCPPKHVYVHTYTCHNYVYKPSYHAVTLNTAIPALCAFTVKLYNYRRTCKKQIPA